MIIRVVIATTLLVSAFVIELSFRPAVTLKPFYLLTGLTYFLTLVYASLHVRFRRSIGFAYLQILGDILLLSLLVYITGGVESAFSFLYVLSIITASILLYRRGAWFSASISWIAYAMMVLVLFHGLIPGLPAQGPEQGITDKRVTYALFAHLLGFLAVGYLSSALSEAVRVTGEELRERRQDLAALQALHRSIIDSIHSGIVTTDPDGVITFMNQAAERITGETLAARVDRPVWEFLGEDRTFLQELVGRIGGGPRFRFEKPYRNSRGEKLYLGMAVAVLRDPRGAEAGFLFVFQDLTEMKKMEAELQLKDRMSVLGQMAAGMAHELRNPLASMTGSVQILKNELALSPDQAELMQVVLDESRRLDQTIRDFLLFARPSRFQPEEADLAQVLSDALVLLRNSAELRPDHRVRTDFDPPCIPYSFDVNQMKQIFWNLAKNSLRAMPAGGTLTIGIVQRQGEGPEVTFSDEGVGMDPEDVQRYFQPFQTAFPEGTGLGLAIVYRNVQEHSGRLSVESARGQGTRFIIQLPAQPLHQEASA